ncbi:MAG: WD40 repeat domain-containing protein [Planctomycetia bacterium]|nr:WD40 repeat domain-containing protein [Planctomycetia bacterium]
MKHIHVRARAAGLIRQAMLAPLLAVAVVSLAAAQEPLTLDNYGRRVHGVAFSPDGKQLATAAPIPGILVWNVATAKIVKVLPLTTSRCAYAVSYSPDGKLLVAGLDRAMNVWQTDDWKEVWTLGQMPVTAEATSGVVHKLVFSTNGDRMVNGFTESTKTGGRVVGVRVWDVENRKEYPSVSQPNQGNVVALTLAPDDNTAVTGDGEGKIIVWDLKEQKKKLDWAAHKPTTREYCLNDMAFSPNGKVLATVGMTPTVAFWDPTNGKQLSTLPTNIKVVRCVRYSPNGKLLAVGGDSNELELWDLASGKLKATLKGHTDKVLCVAFSRDGKRLATGSWDATAKLWDVEKCLTERK